MDKVLKPEKSNKQLRGEKAIQYLAKWVEYLQYKSSQEGKPYVFNQSELEELSGISRKTIRKNQQEVLDLAGQGIAAKKRDGSATVLALQTRVDHLTEENERLNDLLNSLRIHHLRLYEALSDHPDSFEAKQLLSGLHIEYANSSGECPLCGGAIKDTIKKKSNVYALSKKQKGTSK